MDDDSGKSAEEDDMTGAERERDETWIDVIVAHTVWQSVD